MNAKQRAEQQARAAFVTQRINEINEWRQEAVLHAETKEAVERIDARVFELRQALERHLR